MLKSGGRGLVWKLYVSLRDTDLILYSLTIRDYLLTTASTQLLFGKFYTFFSLKWVSMITLLVFDVGSVWKASEITTND
jgi:hypothetical protein